MTAGHRHREVRVPGPIRYLLRRAVFDCYDIERIEASPYPYRMDWKYIGGKRAEYGRLTILGILHRWTGLTLIVKDQTE